MMLRFLILMLLCIGYFLHNGVPYFVSGDAKPLLLAVYDMAIRGSFFALPALQDSSL